MPNQWLSHHLSLADFLRFLFVLFCTFFAISTLSSQTESPNELNSEYEKHGSSDKEKSYYYHDSLSYKLFASSIRIEATSNVMHFCAKNCEASTLKLLNVTVSNYVPHFLVQNIADKIHIQNLIHVCCNFDFSGNLLFPNLLSTEMPWVYEDDVIVGNIEADDWKKYVKLRHCVIIVFKHDHQEKTQQKFFILPKTVLASTSPPLQ